MKCGVQLPPDALFCLHCGSAITGGNLPNAPNSGVTSPAAVAISSTPPALPSATARAKGARRQNLLKQLKRSTWRLTALYLWLKFVVDGVSSRAPFHSAEEATVRHLTSYLSSVGFTPGNPDYVLPLLKFGWLLTITGMSLWQFAGWWIYLAIYPLSILFFYVFYEQLRGGQVPPSEGLSKPQGKAILPIALGLSVAWFLLFGTSTSSKPILVGAFLTALIFLSLAVRAFQRARPVTEKDIEFGTWVQKLGMSAVADKTRLKPENKGAAAVHLKFERFHKGLLLWFVYCFRGRRGRDRMAMYILVEYVVFLMLLACSAVLFWGLAIRVTNPAALSLRQALVVSASHFLPGMPVPDGSTSLPLWTHLGPSLTAWILFVLFIGPAASLLPARQAVYATQVEEKCRVFRALIIQIGKRIRTISEIRDGLQK
jgi:hypothetical protein